MYIPRRDVVGDADASGEADLDGAAFEDINDDEEVAEFLRRSSNIARIEDAARVYTQQAMKVMEAQDATFVDRETLMHVIRVRRKRFYGCLSLPFTFAFFLMFAAAANLHEDITNVYFIESGLRVALAGGSDRIESIEDTWHWLNTTFWPTIFEQRDLFGDRLSDRKKWNRVLTYNQLQGPVLFEQQRSTRQLCSSRVASDMMCYGTSTEGTETYGRSVPFTLQDPGPDENVTLEERLAFYDSAFKVAPGRRLRVMRPEYQEKLFPTDERSYKAFFYGNTPYERNQEHLDYLYQQGWLDVQTKTLTIKALLLNSEIGRPRLESFSLTLAFSRAGGVHAKLALNTIFLKMWYGPGSVAIDCAWVLMLMGVTVFEVLNLLRASREGVLRKTLAKFWTLLQWFIIALGWLCVLGYSYQGMLLSDLLGEYEAVVANQDVRADPNRHLGEALFTAADNITSFNSKLFRLLIADYHLVLMLRFFMAFHAQPRLAVVVNTLEVSLLDILHFLVIVIPTFMAYAISGCFVFGRRMEEFSTFEAAIGVCFKILVESEYDWPALTEEHYWTATLWTWSFMMLLTLLMLNMVLAIVMDAYTEQRKFAGKSETVWETVQSLVERLWNYKSWVSNNELSAKVKGMNRRISRQEFVGTFPAMCDAQLDGLLKACRYQIEVDIDNSMGVKHTMKMAMAVKLIMDKATDSIQELRSGTYGPRSSGTDAPGNGWLRDLSHELSAQNHGMLAIQWKLQQLQWQWQALEATHGKDMQFDPSAAQRLATPAGSEVVL